MSREKRSETFWLASLQMLRFLNLYGDWTSPVWLRFTFKHLETQQLLAPASSSPTDPVALKCSIPDGSGSPPSEPPVMSVIPSWIQSICQPIDQPGYPRTRARAQKRTWMEMERERERGGMSGGKKEGERSKQPAQQKPPGLGSQLLS